MRQNEELTPIPENWEYLKQLHYGAIEKYGSGCGFDYGNFDLGDHQLKIAVCTGWKIVEGRKGMKAKRTTQDFHLAMFCPFTGRPLYEESEMVIPAEKNLGGVQASLF